VRKEIAMDNDSDDGKRGFKHVPHLTIGLEATATARDALAASRAAEAWIMSSEIRGALNALMLCVRVLESDPNDAEAREFSRYLVDATERVERLIARRQLARSA